MNHFPFYDIKTKCRVETDPQYGLIFYSPYDAGLVAELKAQIPAWERVWSKDKKCWMIDVKHGGVLQKLVSKYFDEELSIPAVQPQPQIKKQQLLTIVYISQCKDRNGESAAFGMIGCLWKAVFPEKILREWFEAGPATPGRGASLYSVLGVKQGVTVDDLKNAYRRMVRQWHPDVCKEPDAHNVFIRIQEAYEILSNPIKRGKYDAGLVLQSTISNERDQSPQSNYRSPLRCGLILCETVEKMGRIMVEKILAWEDIVNAQGLSLVVSWPMGADNPLMLWV